MKLNHLLIIIFCLPIITHAQNQNWQWKTYTSTRQIRDIAVSHEHVLCATEGGLLEFDSKNRTFKTWTNTEGLESVDVTSLAFDQYDNLWIGTYNGYLQQYDIEHGTWLTIKDYSDYHIQCLTIKGDSLFVGLDIGISLYLISHKEVKETYKHLGPRIESEISVKKILIHDQEMWAITEQGMTHTYLNKPNLLDPQFWTNETVENGLPNAKILTMIDYQNTYWTSTDSGIFVLTNNKWAPLPNTSSISAADFIVHNNILYVLTNNRLLKYDDPEWQIVKENLPTGLSLASDDEFLYIGSNNGIYLFLNDAFVGSYMTNGPAGNFFSDLAVDLDGALWCCSSDFAGSSGNGFYRMINNEWKVFNKKNMAGLNTDLAVCVSVDIENRKWIGTWGGGLILFEDDTTYSYYCPQNGYLSGLSNDPNYAVIKGIAFDMYGTAWLLNRDAGNGKFLVSVSNDSVWSNFGYAEGFSNPYVWEIAVDLFNRKWITTARRDAIANGVFIFDDHGTPDDPTDDDKAVHLGISDGLLSDNVQAIAIDENNTVWLGTDLGLNYFSDNEIREQSGLQSVNVRALLVDGANNLWVGTNNGVCYFFNETYEWICFNQMNSGLVCDEVISMALNGSTGEIYIGTTKGLSCLKTPFSMPKETFIQLKIYPNPFIPDRHNHVSIENLPKDVTVSIFSSIGYLTNKLSYDHVYGNTFVWDGRDMYGNKVPGGIYLFVVNDQVGNKMIGKIAVLR